MIYLIFSIVAFLGSIIVLLAPHPVFSVLYLVLVFCRVSGLLISIEADLLALLFIVVYVGAIAVLFLFVVIILDVKRRPLSSSHILPVVPAVFLLGVIFLRELFVVFPFVELSREGLFYGGDFTTYISWFGKVDFINPLEALGQVLYTHYLLNFLLVGLVLLLALVGAIVLTLPAWESNGFYKRQHVMHQFSRRDGCVNSFFFT